MRTQIQEMPQAQNAVIETVNPTQAEELSVSLQDTLHTWSKQESDAGNPRNGQNRFDQQRMGKQLEAQPVWENSPTPEVSKKGIVPIPFERFLTRGVSLASIWLERWRTRIALSRLDDHLLKDIGMTRWEAHQEYEKPFWRI